MKNVIIVGSSGMIGHLVLEHCLKRNDVSLVTAIVRRPLGISNSKLKEVIHDNFLDYTSVAEYLMDQDVCFYCLGVYTGQVPTDEFKKITVAYTEAFAKALKEYNTRPLSFCFLSGQGADQSEKSRVLFAKQKGIAENGLLSLHFDKTYIFRPGYIYPETPRKEPNFAYRLLRVLYKPLSKVFPNIGVTSGKLAGKMVDAGLNGGNKVIYENKDIRF